MLQKGQTGNGVIILTHSPRLEQKEQKSTFWFISSHNSISILYSDCSMPVNTLYSSYIDSYYIFNSLIHSKFRVFASHNSDRVRLENKKKSNIFKNNYFFIKVETLFILYFDCGSISLFIIAIWYWEHTYLATHIN